MNGTYPEVEVRAKSIGWKGKVDLLVLGDDACEITDFKTGAADEAHKFQARAYAVMWRLDDELNPLARVVDRIVLAYESQDVDVPPPGASEIDDLGRELLERRQAAEAAVAARPPSARPNAESCRYCGVRQLCDAYWASATQVVSHDVRFGDVEMKIAGRHGPTSWDVVVLRSRDLPPKTPALLRLPKPAEFEAGARSIVSSAWRWVPTTICPSPSGRANCWRAMLAVLRRGQAPSAGNGSISFGPFRLDKLSHTLTRDDIEVPLTSGEFNLLRIFAEHPNQVLSRDHLVSQLRGFERTPFDRSIEVRITRLRRKIEAVPEAPLHLRTVWGEGYLFSPRGDPRS